MPSPLASIVAAGTKLWLDSVDPDLVAESRTYGATGATSNPVIIGKLIDSGRYDAELSELLQAEDASTARVAWQLTDQIVAAAQAEFLPVWEATHGDDGYTSFELDPLLEDPENAIPPAERTAHYIDLGTRWSQGHQNRMIKVPATPAGIDALEELATRGVRLNVTLIFTMRQYEAAREAIWRGASRLDSLKRFKSVYSIFLSRVDVYTQKHVPQLSPEAQGQVGILNAKRMWEANEAFWKQKGTPLRQEIVFASTGAKNPGDPPWKYVAALVGSDIQTNPPETNEAVEASGKNFPRTIDQFPPSTVVDEIDREVDLERLEEQLLVEGIKKFADPQYKLLQRIEERRRSLAI